MKVTRAPDGSPRVLGYSAREWVDMLQRRNGTEAILVISAFLLHLTEEQDDLRRRIEELERRP